MRNPRDLVVKGRVSKGWGIAGTWIKKCSTRNGVYRPLGVRVYPGTLNVYLDGDPAAILAPAVWFYGRRPRQTRKYHPCRFHGKNSNGKSVRAWAVLKVPPRDKSARIEVLAEVKLRDAFDLQDGDRVTLVFTRR